MSIKMPAGYRMAFSTLLQVDGTNAYLIKRQSKVGLKLGQDPEAFRFPASIISCYP